MLDLPLQLTYIRYWRIETWTAIVAVIALIQPWIVAMYKRLFRSGRLEIYETGLPEIGYSFWGATIALYGTLRSRDRELFVKSVELHIRRLEDGVKGNPSILHWIAFRPLTTVVGRTTLEMEVTQPASFMVNPTQPHQYNIFFSDLIIQNKLRQCVEKLQEKWLEHISQAGKLDKVKGKTLDPVQQQRLIALYLDQSYPDFTKTNQYTAALTEIRDLMVWKSGTYELTFIGQTAKPDRTYKRSWLMVLTQEQEAGLRSNAEKILEAACKNIFLAHYFAYPNYLPNDRLTRNRLVKEIPPARVGATVER